MTNFGHRIRWLRYFGRLRPFSEVFSEGQAKVRSKKGQIFKFINVDKKGINLDQFRLRNLMVSFVFAYDPQKLQKSHLKKLRHNWVCFRRQKHSIWGSKIELLT